MMVKLMQKRLRLRRKHILKNNTEKTTDDFVIEEAFEQLSIIVEKLDRPETNLSESIKLYSNGVELLKQCSDTLDCVEKQIVILNEEGNMNHV